MKLLIKRYSLHTPATHQTLLSPYSGHSSNAIISIPWLRVKRYYLHPLAIHQTLSSPFPGYSPNAVIFIPWQLIKRYYLHSLATHRTLLSPYSGHSSNAILSGRSLSLGSTHSHYSVLNACELFLRWNQVSYSDYTRRIVTAMSSLLPCYPKVRSNLVTPSSVSPFKVSDCTS